MVMETPTPQCVGREFVRQYYTMLHEAPEHLHRFYSQNSSFVHGGVEKPGSEQPPVMGQTEIHHKVMSLNFRDCHAKIRQVDSQATVGSAVVVQVTGELSNNGQPMRRFMQTFVLAPQSPKKYYVHNDIFRYQDEVFHDVDTDTEKEEEAGGYLSDSEVENMDSGSHLDHERDMSSLPTFDQPPQLSNGTNHLEEHVEITPVIEEMVPEEPAIQEEEPKEEPKTPEPEPEEQPVMPVDEPVQSKQPCSWAAMVTSGSVPVSMPGNATATSPPKTTVKPDITFKPDTSTGMAPQPRREARPARERQGAVRERGSQGGSIGRGEGEMEEGGRKNARFPDSHQLFVGKLPLDAGVGELKAYFEAYGKVVDLRIIAKGTSNDKKNYGFVIFDNEESVQNILKAKNNLKKFRKDYPPLNVEEKKPRGDSGRPGSGTRTNPRGGGNMGGSLGRGGGPGRGGGRGGQSNLGTGNRPEHRPPTTSVGGGTRGGFNGQRR